MPVERITWVASGLYPTTEFGNVGDLHLFTIGPHATAPDFLTMEVHLEGYDGMEHLREEKRPNAKRYAEDLLKEIMKKAGWVFKPAPKKRAAKKP